MRRVKLVSRYRGIGNVTRKAKPVARVRYDLCCRRTADNALAEGEQPPVQPVIGGNIQVLKSEASLYSDELYTLNLEGKYKRECDFYTQPINVVTGVYQAKGKDGFRELPHRH